LKSAVVLHVIMVWCMAAKVTSGHCSKLSKPRQSKSCEWNVQHSCKTLLLA